MSFSAFAGDIVVVPIRSTNLDVGDAEVVAVLFQQAYSTVSRATVVGPRGVEPGTNADIIARLGPSELIELSVIQLDRRIVLQGTRFDGNGTFVHSAQITTMSLDEMPQVCERLARALFEKTGTAETRTPKNVTTDEAKSRNRLAPERIVGLKVGYGVPLASDRRFNTLGLFQADWRLEGDSYFLEIGVGLLLPVGGRSGTQIGGLVSEIGGSYYLTNSVIAPYLGVGITPRLMFGADMDVFNFAPYGQLGLMFARDSSARLYAELRATQEIVKVEQRYLTELMANMGVGW